MNNSDIANIIKDIKKEYNAYKDGGRTFIQHLAQKIQNTVDEDKTQVLNFFLQEIENNSHGLFSVALQTIIELKYISLAPEIEKIFIKNKGVKDESWKYSIIETLLKLNYVASSSLYHDFIIDYMKTNPGKEFFILVLYCTIEPEKGMPLLSDFYAKFFHGNSQMQSFLESRIGFLVSYFTENNQLSLAELNRLVMLKNEIAGQNLKKALLDYFDSNLASKYSKELIGKDLELYN